MAFQSWEDYKKKNAGNTGSQNQNSAGGQQSSGSAYQQRNAAYPSWEDFKQQRRAQSAGQNPTSAAKQNLQSLKTLVKNSERAAVERVRQEAAASRTEQPKSHTGHGGKIGTPDPDVTNLRTMTDDELAAETDRRKQQRGADRAKTWAVSLGTGGLYPAALALQELGRRLGIQSDETDYSDPDHPIGSKNDGLPNLYRQSERSDRAYQAAKDALDARKAASYDALPNNPDFAQKSKYDSSVHDFSYDYVNNAGTARAFMDSLGQENLGTTHDYGAFQEYSGLFDLRKGWDPTRTKYMTDEERAIYNYLYDPNNTQASEDYIASIMPKLNERASDQIRTDAAERAKTEPVRASLQSTFEQPAKILGTVGSVGDFLINGKIDPNAWYNEATIRNEATRSATMENLREKATKLSDNPVVSNVLGTALPFLYGTGMSMSDNLVNIATSGGNKAISLILMGAEASSDAIREAKARGMSDDQALNRGLIAGGIEALTESIGLDNLFDAVLKGGDKGKILLRQVASEGAEEGVGDIMNLAVDAIFDILYGTDKGEFVQNMQQYREAGYSEKDAFWAAMKDFGADTALDTLGGALSGFGFGVGANTINDVRGSVSARNIGKEIKSTGTPGNVRQVIDAGLKADPSTKAYQIAGELSDRLQEADRIESQLENDIREGKVVPNGERENKIRKQIDALRKISDNAIGNLYLQINAASEQQNAADELLQKAAEEMIARGSVSRSTAQQIAKDPMAYHQIDLNGDVIGRGDNMSNRERRSGINKVLRSAADEMNRAGGSRTTDQSAREQIAGRSSEITDRYLDRHASEIVRQNPETAADRAFSPREGVYFDPMRNRARTGNQSSANQKGENRAAQEAMPRVMTPHSTVKSGSPQDATFDGDRVKVTGIDHITDDGQVAVTLEDGRAVYLEDLDVHDVNAAQIYDLSGTLGNENAARTFISYYTGGDPIVYSTGFMSIYNAARAGASQQAAVKNSLYASELSATQQQAAFYAGQNAAKADQENQNQKENSNGTESGDVSVRGSSERNDRARAGERAGGVAAWTGEAQEQGSGSNQSSERLGRAIEETRVRGFQFTAATEGITGGVSSAVARTVPSDVIQSTPELRQIYDDAKKNGIRLQLYTGTLAVQRNGRQFNVRGIHKGDSVYAKIDGRYGADQIYRHEYVHHMIENDPSMLENMVGLLRAQMTEEQFNSVVQSYAQAHFADASGNILESENYILEEMLADAYGQLNGMDQQNQDAATRTFAAIAHDTLLSVAEITAENRVLNASELTKFSFDDAQRFEYMKPFREQLKDFMDKEHRKEIFGNDGLLLGPTPKVLQDIGLPKLPVMIDQGHVSYSLEGTYKKDEYRDAHVFDLDEFGKLPEKIADPIAIIADPSRGDLIVYVDMLNKMKMQTIVPIRIESGVRFNGAMIDVQKVKSAHGRGAAVSELLSAIKNDTEENIRVFYVNKKRLQSRIGQAVLNYGLSAPNGTIHMITDPGSPVKMTIKNSTETSQFKRWFKGSKIVNEDGSPKVMYHGTLHGGFDVFDGGKDYWYFADSREYANAFAGIQENGEFYESTKEGMEKGYYTPKVYEAYLSVKNPFVTEDQNIIEDALYWDRTLAQQLRDKGYDALMLKDGSQVIVLNQTQIKSATDNIGTFDPKNPNIRFSLDDIAEADVERVQRDNAQLKKTVDHLASQFKLIRGFHPSDAMIAQLARKTLKDYSSAYKIDTLQENLKTMFDYIADADAPSWDEVTKMGVGMTKEIVKQSQQMDRELYDTYEDARTFLRKNRIVLTDVQRGEARYMSGSYGNYRSRLFGSVNIVNEDGMSLDQAWQRLSEMNPELFDPNASEGDQVAGLYDAVQQMKPQYINPYGMDIDGVAYDLFLHLIDQYFDMPDVKKAAKDAGELAKMQAKTKQQLAMNRDEMKRAYDRRLLDLRKESIAQRQRAGKLWQAAKDCGDTEAANRYMNEFNRLQEKYSEKLLRQRAAYSVLSEYKAADRAQRIQHEQLIKYRSRVESGAKQLSKWLQTPTEQRHVPEVMRNTVYTFLNSIDFSGKSDTRTKYWKDNLQAVKEYMVRADAASVNGEADAYVDIDPEFTENVQKLMEYARGNMRVTDMDLEHLKLLHKIVEQIKTACQNVNTIIVDGRRQAIESFAVGAIQKAESIGFAENNRFTNSAFGDLLTAGNIKPVYFFRHIGGPMQELFEEMRKGQSQYAFHLQEAKNYYNTVKEKYHVDDWLNKPGDKLRVTTMRGDSFELTRDEALALYAIHNRELRNKSTTDAKHLRDGGFVFDREVKIKDEKGKSRTVRHGTPHPLNAQDIAKITSWLTAEQKAYADECVRYMSTEMAALGNEVSMKMMGVKRFTEQYYFPYKSSRDFLASAPGQQSGQASRLLHKGFTKQTVAFANNPIVLQGFTDVFGKHVNEMCMYNAMAIPQENMIRVYNWTSGVDPSITSTSVKVALQNAYGQNAKKYVDTFLADLNGDMIADPREQLAMKWTSKFKRAAVMANLSVAIQQPSAIVRAVALINPKYFVGKPKLGSYAEAKKYAGTAIIKDIGGFDTATGRGAAEWITETKADTIAGRGMDLIDKAGGFLPEKMDQITWGAIWEACKREIADTTDLTGEELLKAAGERFDEVIEMTQVYDSVLTRSQLMRSKSGMVQAATAFMAEPTVTFNMLYDAITNTDSKTKLHTTRTIAAVIGATIFNTLLKSIVYAVRDDDDQTYLEKYVESVTGSLGGERVKKWGPLGVIGHLLTSELSPVTMIPYVKDIVSLVQGYDVSRTDMSVFADLVKAVNNLSNENKTWPDRLLGLAEAIANMYGIPAKNVRRDIMAIFNTTVDLITKDQSVDPDGLLAAVYAGMQIDHTIKSNTEDAYEAYMKGNTDKAASHAKAIEKFYEDKVNENIKKGETQAEAKKNARSSVNKAVSGVLADKYEAAKTPEERAKIRTLASTITVGNVPIWINKAPSIAAQSLYDASEAGDQSGLQAALNELKALYNDRVKYYMRTGLSNADAAKQARSDILDKCTDILKPHYKEASSAAEKVKVKQLALRITTGNGQLYSNYNFDSRWKE